MTLNRRFAPIVVCAALAGLTPASALAEGAADVGVSQPLQTTSVLRADVSSTAERICWTGRGRAAVSTPADAALVTLNSGACTTSPLPATGTYFVRLLTNQQVGDAWDIAVQGAGGVAIRGRVWSINWVFATGTFAASGATNASFYARLGGGAAGHDAVTELRLRGLSGNAYEVGANGTGVDGPSAGRSVSTTGNTVRPTIPLYLAPPDLATYDPLTPEVTAVSFDAGAGAACAAIVPGVSVGTFRFTSNVDASYHLECDLNRDGVFNVVGSEDLLLVGSATVGANSVTWDGRNNAGTPVPAGSYSCIVRVNVGEFHYVARDVETSYEGMRLFEVSAAGVRRPLTMFWNDSAVVAGDINMPNGDRPTTTSGATGIGSGDPAVAATPHGITTPGNARAWGDFSGNGRGNNTFLDTFTWVSSATSTSISVTAIAAGADTDMDGLSDFLELCTLGTSPTNPDTDGDGIGDSVETNAGSRVDTDMDGTIDALDLDSDGDGILDSVEGVADADMDGIGNWRDLDSDADGLSDSVEGATDLDTDGTANYLDTDDDGDGILTRDELADDTSTGSDSNGDGMRSPYDTDADNDGIPDATEGRGDADMDGVPNYLDLDSDGDGIPDADEGVVDGDADGLPDYLDVDSDGDSIPDSVEGTADTDGDGTLDRRDLDSDGDGVLDAVEAGPTPATPRDTDSDGTPDYRDADDDADGISTATEVADTVMFGDVDGDGIPAYLDLDSDGDGVPDAVDGTDDPNGNGIPSYLDPLEAPTDTDGDGIRDTTECVPGTTPCPDTDGDGIADYLDPDDDGDGIPTMAERPGAMSRDTDMDGTPDYLDADDDGDGIPTSEERPGGADRDTDMDGTPDHLDPDDDGDGIPTATERTDGAMFGNDVDADGTPNWLDTDSDGDGISDSAEGTGDSDGDGIPSYLDPDERPADSDGDGVPDSVECPTAGSCPDTDGDGVADYLDPDDDGDGVPTAVECPSTASCPDTDGDGVADYLDTDDDGDGVPTADECLTAASCRDTDGDGIADYLDTDDDGDGVPTADELGDANGNGIADYLEHGVTPAVGAGLSGGGVCSVATGSGHTPAWLGWGVLAALGLLAARRRRRGLVTVARASVVLTALAAAGLTSRAQAQHAALDNYRPAELSSDGFVTSRPSDLGHLRFDAQLHLDNALSPLVYEAHQGDSSTQRFAVVSSQVAAHATFALGLADRVVVYAGLPVNLVIEGDARPMGVTVAAPDGTSLGDPWLGARVRIFGESDDVFALAAQATVSAPLAETVHSDNAYSGDSGFTLHPELVGELRFGKVHLAANAGLRLRSAENLGTISIGNELTWSAAFIFPIAETDTAAVDVHVETFGSSTLSSFGDREQTDTEILAGVKVRTVAGLVVGIGAGPGLTRGYGTPEMRIVGMVGFGLPEATGAAPPRRTPPPAEHDRDHDGLADDVDQCPDEPEDHDEFQDDDGCPDPDNDRDGVPDVSDRAPNDPEDADAFEDADGAPDPDNDQDGVLDADDRCPNVAEDRDGIQEEDGCPETDADSDQVLDAEDHCPLTPGVRNARNPECTGCPALACVSATGTIRILERVEFATNSDVILSRSQPVLDAVRQIMATSPQIRRLRIEGHTDDRGDDAANLDLSRRRAQSVLRWLTENGIDAGRLESEGYGETRPLAPNSTNAGRQNNRRVEFHITDPAPPEGASDTTVQQQ